MKNTPPSEFEPLPRWFDKYQTRAEKLIELAFVAGLLIGGLITGILMTAMGL